MTVTLGSVEDFDRAVAQNLIPDNEATRAVRAHLAQPLNLAPVVELVCRLDDISSANNAANYVMLGAVFSLLVERLGLSLDDIERKVNDILRASVESPYISSPGCAARCKVMLDILRAPPSSQTRN